MLTSSVHFHLRCTFPACVGRLTSHGHSHITWAFPPSSSCVDNSTLHGHFHLVWTLPPRMDILTSHRHFHLAWTFPPHIYAHKITFLRLSHTELIEILSVSHIPKTVTLYTRLNVFRMCLINVKRKKKRYKTKRLIFRHNKWLLNVTLMAQ